VGQVIAGCTVVRTPHDHRLADLPVVIFPGNVGGQEALATAVERLSRS
ncbi:MAG TPA: four-carbon acid sugar kinase family protein, partial [Spirochaetia bacterium]|nr:four-carbon acid sugar kinase family protein [Spirochaetia bacterium]